KWNHNFNEKNRGELIFVSSQYKYNILFEAEANNDFDFGYVLNENQAKFNFKYDFSKKHKFSYGLSGKTYAIDPGTIAPIGENSEITPKELDREKGLESAFYVSDSFEIN